MGFDNKPACGMARLHLSTVVINAGQRHVGVRRPGRFPGRVARGRGARHLITGRGRFRARLTEITLHRLHLSAAEEHLPWIGFVAVPADAVLVLLPIGGVPSPIWGGIAMQVYEIITLGPGQRVHVRTDGPCRWGTIRLPAQDLAGYGRALRRIPPPASPLRTGLSGGRVLVHDRSTHGVVLSPLDTTATGKKEGAVCGLGGARRHRRHGIGSTARMRIVPARRLVADHDRLGDLARQIGCASYGAGRGNP